MKRNTLSACLGSIALLSVHLPASAIQIVFDYSLDTSGFFSTQLSKDVLQAAGNTLGGRLADNLLAITSSGSNSFTANFNDPSSGASTSRTAYSVEEDVMVVFVGAQDLGGSLLGIAGPGGFNANGSRGFLNTASTRGQAGAPDTDFGPWGGTISFDSNANWYFDSDLSTSGDIIGSDFYTVALHELGHVLGLGTATSWDNLIVNGALVGPTTGTVSLDATGGHFANGTRSEVNGVAQGAAMTPSVLSGTRKEFTDLDFAALKDIGWQVTPVPVPAAVWLFASGLTGLFVFGRRKKLREG
ncbi:MAG TPA: matrixin family metalloprotease [Gammaproteobacteria bacterium]|nr:matrixin family metalloprotease [Gammaproteobacteria bacterium]